MKFQNFPSALGRFRRFVTIQTAGLVVALVVALVWLFGAVATLQKNYQHQRQVDTNAQQIEIMKLKNLNSSYQQAYLKSDEFLELSARENLGKALPGEKLVILPSSKEIKDSPPDLPVTKPEEVGDNFKRWVEFFLRKENSAP